MRSLPKEPGLIDSPPGEAQSPEFAAFQTFDRFSADYGIVDITPDGQAGSNNFHGVADTALFDVSSVRALKI